MTKTKKAMKPAKAGPVELHDEALSDAAGGLIGLLVPAVRTVSNPIVKTGITDGTSNTVAP